MREEGRLLLRLPREYYQDLVRLNTTRDYGYVHCSAIQNIKVKHHVTHHNEIYTTQLCQLSPLSYTPAIRYCQSPRNKSQSARAPHISLRAPHLSPSRLHVCTVEEPAAVVRGLRTDVVVLVAYQRVVSAVS